MAVVNSQESKKRSIVMLFMTFKTFSRESVITCFYAFKEI